MILVGVAPHRAHCMLVACSNMVMFITKNWYLKIGKDFDHIHKDYSAVKGLQMLRNLIDSLNAKVTDMSLNLQGLPINSTDVTLASV